jgi:hypothetical protein
VNNIFEKLREVEFVAYVAAVTFIAVVLMMGHAFLKGVAEDQPTFDRFRPSSTRRRIAGL